MKKTRSQRLAPFLAVAAGLSWAGVLGCTQPAVAPVPPPAADSQPQSVVQFRHCWNKPLSPAVGDVRVFLDASGSMVGLADSVPGSVDWLLHAVSQVRGSILEVGRFEVCQFSQSMGVGRCRPAGQPINDYVPFGYTNLHDAIREAAQAEVSFILTDGVGATGVAGSGDCAGGVDAACVGRALRDAVHQTSGDVDELNRGLWLAPLLAVYDGKYFTEEKISPESFARVDTVERIRVDTEVEAVVQQPRAGADGRLEFGYRGPRALLLMVLARNADVGRAVVQALWERSRTSGLQRRDDMKGFQSGLALLNPVEVFPGHLNPVSWKEWREVDDPAEQHGVVDFEFQESQGKNRMVLQCPPTQTFAWSTFRVKGVVREDQQASGCVDIGLLPAFRFAASPLREEDAEALAQVFRIREFQKPSPAPYKEFAATLVCTARHLPECGQGELEGQWLAIVAYERVSQQLAEIVDAQDRETANIYPNLSLIANLSTSHPSRQPHRIFGLLETLQQFYRGIAQDKRSLVLNRFSLCRGG